MKTRYDSFGFKTRVSRKRDTACCNRQMPFLPAFFTIISLGLQCHYEPEWSYHLYCDWDKGLMQTYAKYWEDEFDSLPLGIQRELQGYETQYLQSKLADYRQFCPPYNPMDLWSGRDPFVVRHFPPTFEGEIARIFCPGEWKKCQGWKFHGQHCLKPICRANPIYKKISEGIFMLHMGCFQTQNSPQWRNMTALIERIA